MGSVTLIYGLTDPTSGMLRYIGKTKGTLHRRWLAHINDVTRGRTYIPRHRWIAGLLECGLKPEIFEIEAIPESGDWAEAEQFWIGYFISIGCNLLNATAGGEGIVDFCHTKETREKQKAAALKRYRSQAERLRTGAAVRQAHARPEVKERLSLAQRDRGPEWRKKLSDAAKIHRNTAEAKAAVSAIMTGRVVSLETRRKISKSKIGQKRPPESVAKQAKTMRGRKHSKETIEKMRLAALRRYRGSEQLAFNCAGGR